ncbi:hypothetical protein DFP72DRAFT_847873 [Ephemerocybe angulata]|uniref:Uncharacterized protein n=1 Tax=Ephemerocybe angulata TaxID=980116 RepID=A0A8H6HZ01_9AGAR|nr:hypothetical protein DFP72DRAFT_847873 [Tulosesus angulatus]
MVSERACSRAGLDVQKWKWNDGHRLRRLCGSRCEGGDGTPAVSVMDSPPMSKTQRIDFRRARGASNVSHAHTRHSLPARSSEVAADSDVGGLKHWVPCRWMLRDLDNRRKITTERFPARVAREGAVAYDYDEREGRSILKLSLCMLKYRLEIALRVHGEPSAGTGMQRPDGRRTESLGLLLDGKGYMYLLPGNGNLDQPWRRRNVSISRESASLCQRWTGSTAAKMAYGNGRWVEAKVHYLEARAATGMSLNGNRELRMYDKRETNRLARSKLN